MSCRKFRIKSPFLFCIRRKRRLIFRIEYKIYIVQCRFPVRIMVSGWIFGFPAVQGLSDELGCGHAGDSLENGRKM